MAKKELIIFPFNGNGLEALDCINYDDFNVIGFIDDNLSKKPHDQIPLLSRSALLQYPQAYVLAVPGSPASYRNRHEIIASLNISQERLISIVHSSAKIGRDVKIGHGCLLMAGVVITSNAEIGDYVCVLPNSVIHHDVKIGEYSLIGSNVAIAGGTKVGRNCYIGSGSNIINGITIGDFSLIGLGSNVLKDVNPDSTVAGNPARQI